MALALIAAGGIATLSHESNSRAECDPIKVKMPSVNDTWNKEGSFAPVGIRLFTGNSNKPLAQSIANHLGMSLGKISVTHFADGEVNVVVNENVRGKDVYVIQGTSPPVNETLMELLVSRAPQKSLFCL